MKTIHTTILSGITKKNYGNKTNENKFKAIRKAMA